MDNEEFSKLYNYIKEKGINEVISNDYLSTSNVDLDDFITCLYLVAIDCNDVESIKLLNKKNIGLKGTDDDSNKYDIISSLYKKNLLTEERLKKVISIYLEDNDILKITSDLFFSIINKNDNSTLESFFNYLIFDNDVTQSQLTNYDEKEEKNIINDKLKEMMNSQMDKIGINEDNSKYKSTPLKEKKKIFDDKLKEMMNSQMDKIGINEYNSEYKSTPLNFACINKKKSIVDTLVVYGVDLNKPNLDQDGDTPLITACKVKNKNIIETLIKNGANVNQENNHGDTPLIIACKKRYKEIVELLLDNGAEVNHANKDGNTPLIISCKNEENIEIVKILVEYEADLNIKNKNGETALDMAEKTKKENIIGFLTKNFDNKRLFDACTNTNEEALRELIKKGVDINIENKEGDTPLIIACKNNNESIAQILVQKGADVNKKDKQGRTPLYISCQNKNEGIIKVILKSNRKNINIEITSDIFIMMVNNNFINMLKYIIKHIMMNDYFIVELLGYYKNRKPISRENFSNLISNNINKIGINNLGSSGEVTPLICACNNGNEEIVKLFTENGVDINKSNEEGDTPLIIACRNNYENIMNILTEHKADVNKENEYGETPLSIACTNDYGETTLSDADIDKNYKMLKTLVKKKKV